MWNPSPVICRLVLFLGLIGCLQFASAQTGTAVPEVVLEPTAAVRVQQLSPRDAIVLGLVEGITEFLPVSSTGHLIITNRALGLDAETPLRNDRGELLWLEKPTEDSPGVPLTLKAAADTYIVVIQLGAIAAVMLVFWAQLRGMARGLLGQNAAGMRLLRNVVLAFVPVVVVGLLLDDLIEQHLFSLGTVIAALVSGAVLMLGAERWRRGHRGLAESRKEPADLTAKEAVQIGLMQCLALWPGMSRSMVTMVGGYFSGLAPARAAEFSFLVGLPVLGGAAVYKAIKAGPDVLAAFGWPEMLLGAGVAAISGAAAVRFLVAYLSRYGLGIFAIYRVLLAAFLAAWFYL